MTPAVVTQTVEPRAMSVRFTHAAADDAWRADACTAPRTRGTLAATPRRRVVTARPRRRRATAPFHHGFSRPKARPMPPNIARSFGWPPRRSWMLASNAASSAAEGCGPWPLAPMLAAIGIVVAFAE